MESRIRAALLPYCEDDELIVDGDVQVLDSAEKTEVLFRVDILTDEFDVTVHIEKEHNDAQPRHAVVYFRNSSRKLSNEQQMDVESIMTRVMELFVNERDAGLDGDLLSPVTPSGQADWAGMDVGPFDGIDEEHQTVLMRHSQVVNGLFGLQASTVINHLVRISISAEHLHESTRAFYEISPRQNLATVAVQFAEDYVDHPTPPQPSIKSDGSSFSALVEQVGNMARLFVHRRWSQLGKQPIPALGDRDDRLQFLKEQLSIKSGNSGAESVVQHMLTKYVGDLIGKKHEQYAMALCLWTSQMDVLEAMKVYKRAGGTLPQEDIVQQHVASDNFTNFILEMLTYLTLRLFDACNVCAICDEPVQINLPDIRIAKGKVCTSYKCQFEFITQGRCSSVPMTICPTMLSKDILDNSNICDILINIMYCAAKSNRRDIIMKPFPPQFKKKDGSCRFDALTKTIDSLPGLKTMSKHCGSEADLKKLLGSDGYELLLWTFCTNRAAMFKLSHDKSMKVLGTEHQYVMLMDEPEVTKRFVANRKKYGSYFAFHGSAFENVHSITRRRLKVGTKTNLQVNGSAYGSGVYCARDLQTSLSYARPGACWPKSKFGSNQSMRCCFICEVAKLDGVPTTPNPYYVIDNADAISVRFFLFFPDTTTANHSVSIDDLNLDQFV